ncbi:uncharacterized protein SOCE26_003230 [Sorangium cellulosum]|uniref:TIR domain-containing protein n=1 Tax=Sorangium cellulosum TaxID=56 RepID=A0A2L0EI18_SORCE|nr:uncharacterized protein SOCE26_003230 [Sorangium cellulosum]
MTSPPARPVKVFCSYSIEDEAYRQEFDMALAGMRGAGLVETWSFRSIPPGEAVESRVAQALNEADIIVLLVSASFLDSDYCWDIEMRRAVERHDRGDARLVPVVVRSCEWSDAPFAGLSALPQDAKPVASWTHRDEAWTSVARGIRTLVSEIRSGARPARTVRQATPAMPTYRDAAGFLSAAGVVQVVSTRDRDREKPIDGPILVYENSFQKTWLLITESKIACILDDLTKPATYDPLKWQESVEDALPVRIEPYRRTSGFLHFGSRRRQWLYSYHLHRDPSALKSRLEALLKRAG